MTVLCQQEIAVFRGIESGQRRNAQLFDRLRLGREEAKELGVVEIKAGDLACGIVLLRDGTERVGGLVLLEERKKKVKQEERKKKSKS